MTFPKDDLDGDPISAQDVYQNLLPRNSRRKTTSPHKFVLPWYVFAIPVGTFIANKAIQSVLNFTSDTNNVIDIAVVIVTIVALAIYTRYYFGGKNG